MSNGRRWSIRGPGDFSFFVNKKNPAPASDEEGWIIPADTESLISVSMASLSAADREYSLTLGGDGPGRRSTAQSYG